MRRAEMPLFALESGDAITNFDMVAFSVGYEMAFSTILNMLNLAHIPLHSRERTGLSPLVVAGGTAMYNAEPIADFLAVTFTAVLFFFEFRKALRELFVK